MQPSLSDPNPDHESILQVQEYVRLLSTWCDWNCHSRQFILGSALLNMGEPDKASDWMIKAAAGISAQSDQGWIHHVKFI